MVVGLAMNSVQYFNEEHGYPREAAIPDEKMLAEVTWHERRLWSLAINRKCYWNIFGFRFFLMYDFQGSWISNEFCSIF
jgi:hypothetical protein